MLAGDFYTIESIDVNDSVGKGTIDLNPRNPIFEGHFPGEPVVPGVTMIRMCEELVSKSLGGTWRIKESKSIKFLSVIDPRTDSKLGFEYQLKADENGTKLEFNLTKMDGILSFKLSGLVQKVI